MTEPRRRPLTPDQIRAQRIRRVGLRKGYDASEVNELLNRLADEAASRDSIISSLFSRLRRAEIEAYARRHGTLPAAPDQLHIDQMLAQIDQPRRVQYYAEEQVGVVERLRPAIESASGAGATATRLQRPSAMVDWAPPTERTSR